MYDDHIHWEGFPHYASSVYFEAVLFKRESPDEKTAC